MRPSSSPWGKIQSCNSFSSAEDVYVVSTAGHGGLMMTVETASRLKISAFGDGHSTKSSNWMCFEEDCQISVAALALTLSGEFKFDQEKVKSMIFSIKSYNNDYLCSLDFESFGEIGNKVKLVIESLAEELKPVEARRIAREKSDKMRKEKHPDLIVSAIGVSRYSDLIPYLKSAPKFIKESDEHQQQRDILRALSLDVEFYEKDEDALFGQEGVVLVYTADDRRYLVRNYDSSRELNVLSACEKIGSFIN